MIAYAAAIFLGAFLLFQVQPLIGKSILPWFGGGPAVWTVCMLFFQTLLLSGYAYAHFSTKHLRPRTQVWLHVALLLAAIGLMPIVPGDKWKPEGADYPVARILLLLTACLGMPYFILSSTGPVIQAWFYRRYQRSPYALYSLSNLGSLLALLSFPFVLEPNMPLREQAKYWCWAFGVYAVLSSWCAIRAWRYPAGETESADPADGDAGEAPPSAGTVFFWMALPACASVLLLAVTNELCQNLVTPFLWILPLALYLLSFIVCFSHRRWYSRPVIGALYLLSMAGTCYVLLQHPFSVPLANQVGIYCSALFLCCMLCHGELYRLRPNPKHLTGYYLLISLGGALGGIFVGLIAPLVFETYFELHLGLAGCAVLTLAAMFCDKGFALRQIRLGWTWPLLALLVCFLCITLFVQWQNSWWDTAAIDRNFYGILRIYETGERDSEDHLLILANGSIRHGAQFTAPDRRRWGTSYFSRQSGAGMAFLNLVREGGRKIGIIGLGVGTLATYGTEGDVFRIYEINPAVERMARDHFTYLRDSKATISVVLGDARLSLEREEPQEFDIFIVDAFTSDSIPVHLLTREAFELYLRHLRPDGLIGINIANYHVNLEPVVAQAAKHFGLHSTLVHSGTDPKKAISPCKWVILARENAIFEVEELKKAGRDLESTPDLPLWTDDFSNLFRILNP
jgi:hypothetical protein